VSATAGRRERTKERNRAAIIAAGREVFAELGYGAATVRDVIRRTGLAAGTFYNYFPDKESVFRAMLDESTRELRARLRAARAEGEDLEGFVGNGYRALFGFIAEDPTMFALMRRNAGTIRSLLGDPMLGAGVEELREDLDGAVAAGALPPLDTRLMAAAMTGVGFEVATLMVERDPVDVDGAARFATDLFLGGIGRLAQRSP
jgi:AcrR family transcriptional regulator